MSNKLYSTVSDKTGFRLAKLELLNWGTFDKKVYKINPDSHNSLLTGENASGKSTLIDALLTLIVPEKNHRFYNQSSGVKSKGDRSERSYVLGEYGNIHDDEKGRNKIQALRDENTVSFILATFQNAKEETITIFQVRWFSNSGELKRVYALARTDLSLTTDFAQFSLEGNWKERLRKKYNQAGQKKVLDLYDGPKVYAEKLAALFGMRSEKGLQLFNHIVGVKVLDDITAFVQQHMLEKQDYIGQYEVLSNGVSKLQEANLNIEKAKIQIELLQPIQKDFDKRNTMKLDFRRLNEDKEKVAYWLNVKDREFCEEEQQKTTTKKTKIEDEIERLKSQKEEMNNQINKLFAQIQNSEVGRRIEDLERQLKDLKEKKDKALFNFKNYKEVAKKLEIISKPNLNEFEENRATLDLKIKALEKALNDEKEQERHILNKIDEVKEEQKELEEKIEYLKKRGNKISGPTARIRDEIANALGVRYQQLPFVGELIKVNEEEKGKWEESIEKVLHNFAHQVIVPEELYEGFNNYVNSNHLGGRLVYRRYIPNHSPKSYDLEWNSLIEKITVKQDSVYKDWLTEILERDYNFLCFDQLHAFNQCSGKALTDRGLIKFSKSKHEKDDRKRRFVPVLGWDNKELLIQLFADLQSSRRNLEQFSEELSQRKYVIKRSDEQRMEASNFLAKYNFYYEIDWKEFANEIEDKEKEKKKLEESDQSLQVLQQQLDDEKIKVAVCEEEITAHQKSLYDIQNELKNIQLRLTPLLEFFKYINEQNTEEVLQHYPDLSEVTFYTIEEKKSTIIDRIKEAIHTLESKLIKVENRLQLGMQKFRNPAPSVLDKHPSWRMDVMNLSDSDNADYAEEYVLLFENLETENLPKFEKKFQEYMQETIIQGVTGFKIFFDNWSDTIRKNIDQLNDSLKLIDFTKEKELLTYIQLTATEMHNVEVKDFRKLIEKAVPNFKEFSSFSIEEKMEHFRKLVLPLMRKLENEKWRDKVMDARKWFRYKAEEFHRNDNTKFKSYENMGQLSGGEKAQMTYTILGAAIAYQFGLTKEKSNSFRFIAIDEAFKAQDEKKAKYLLDLCKQLHLQLLVVTPADNIHIVQDHISFVHLVERRNKRNSELFEMSIQHYQEQKALAEL